MNVSDRDRHESSAEAPGQPGPRRKIILRLALVGVSILAGLAIVEIAFRVSRGTAWYERLVEEQVSDGYPFRLPVNEKPGRANPYRILFLGDSFTYGVGVDDGSKIFVRLVEQRLNAEQPHPQTREYVIFNGGLPGSLTAKWVTLFDYQVDRFKPSLVVAVFFLRDGLADVLSTEQFDKIREGMAKLEDEGSLLYRYSYTYRFFRERRELTELSRKYLAKMRKGYLGGPDETREWKQAQTNLLWIKEQTLQRGGRFVMVIFPVLFELNEDYPLRDVCNEIETFCHDHDIPVMSLLPAFTHQHAPSLWVSPFDQHPNERANALAADAIYGFLERFIRPNEENPGAETTDGRRSY